MGIDITVVYVDHGDSDEVRTALSRLGETVDVVDTAAGCLSLLADPTVGCVVATDALPGATTVELCRRIRSRRLDVPVVAYPADGTEALAGELVAAGASGYVPQSQGVETLVARVDELLPADGEESTAAFSEADERVREEPTRFAGALERSPIAIVEWTPEFDVRAWNDAASQLFGFTTAEAIGRPATELVVPPDDRTDVLEYWRTIATAGEDASGTDRRRVGRAVRKDGTTITCEWIDVPIVDDAGDVAGVRSFVRDVTDERRRVRAFEQLHRTTSDLLRAESATEMAEIVIEATERIFDRPLAAVRLTDEDATRLEVAATSVRLEETTGEIPDAEPGDHSLWEAFTADEPTVVEDTDTIELPYRIDETAGNAVFHPLGDHGLISVAPSSDGALDGTDIHLIHVLAATTEAALDRARRDRKLERTSRELAARKGKIESLHGTASRLDDCKRHRDVYELTVEAAEEVLNFDVCVVDIARDGYLVKEAISAELDGEELEKMPIDAGVAGKTYRNGRTYCVDDLSADDDVSPAREEFRSVVSVPLGDRGVFQAVSTEPSAFDDDDVELAELLISHVTDALDRIDFEEQLRTERDRFAALFENVPDAVVVGRHDAESNLIVDAVNPAFERVFGYDESELLDERLERFIVPPGRSSEAKTFNRLANRGEVLEAEVRRRAVDGLRDFMLRVVPMEGEDTSESVGLYTDVTERKQREKRVEILNRVLRHDLRNGMNIVRGCAEMLENAVADDERRYAEIIQGRADELVELAEKTRAAERTFDQGGETTNAPIDLCDAVRRTSARLENEYPDVDVSRSVPDRCFVRADAYLERALYQVLENAVEHNDSPTPSVDVSVREHSDGELVRLTISDDGPGIPEDERELLEGNREITQLRHASGLGLWLVNWIVVGSGGQLRFRENDPQGTTVVVDLPRTDDETEPGTDADRTLE
ncbi:PAS domain S-box protein [Natrarchaeobius oligotrophus]|uniref:PAS domain S-box protein n=1 Tax=Natrarchaeobius chitinivorans TaxID=1679083 RepID=A0A3N6N2V9_NATCH|nr:PAS domain S-box protein [Natrarchaeobius chitinivorans]